MVACDGAPNLTAEMSAATICIAAAWQPVRVPADRMPANVRIYSLKDRARIEARLNYLRTWSSRHFFGRGTPKRSAASRPNG
jgi:hypothetical protein